MRAKLFRLPQMFLLNSGDKVSQLVDGQLEVLDNLVQGSCEGVVVHVGEDVVDTTVFEQVLLRRQDIYVCRIKFFKKTIE